MKISPRPLFPLHQTLQLALAFGQVVFSLHPPNTDLAIGLPDGEAWFPLLQSPMAVSVTPLQPTLGNVHVDLRLVCSCSATETHFMKLPTNSYCADVAPEAVWNLVVIVATKERRFLHAMRFGTQWSRSVSLCGRPLCGSAVDAPRHFHFTITGLIVDRGSSSRAEI